MTVINVALPFLCHCTWPSQENFVREEELYVNYNASEYLICSLRKFLLYHFVNWFALELPVKAGSLILFQMHKWISGLCPVASFFTFYAYLSKRHMEKNWDWAPEPQHSHPFYSPKWLKELCKQDKYSLEDGKWKQKQFALEFKLMGTKPVALLTKPCCLL